MKPRIIFVIVAIAILAGAGGYYFAMQNDAGTGGNEYIVPPAEKQKNEEEIPPKEVTLDLSTEFARNYQTILSAELKRPVNFGDRYRMALVGCGSACGYHALLDKTTGKVYLPPVSEDLSLYSSVDFSVNSSDLTLRYADGRTEIYRFNGDRFVLQ